MRKLPVKSVVMLSAFVLVAGTAQGQSAATSAKSAADAASAPSERVRREAANPMRIILEAAKIRRKPQEAEAQAVANTPLPTPAVVSIPVALPAPLPTAVAVPEQPTAALESLPPPPTATPALDPTLLPPHSEANLEAPMVAVPMMATAPAVSRLAGLVGFAPLPAQVPTPVPSAPPRLLAQVSPEIPGNVLRRVREFTELEVQLTINRDGSVTEVSVVSPGFRAVEPYVVEALERWRYEPQAQRRIQKLVLIFSDLR